MTPRPPPAYLFVYGSLRRDHPEGMSRLLQPGSHFVGPATLRARWLDLGAYPGIRDCDDASSRVSGELHRLDDPEAVLARTDAWEGCTADDPQPHEYERVVREVVGVDGRPVDAWVYLYRDAAPAS